MSNIYNISNMPLLFPRSISGERPPASSLSNSSCSNSSSCLSKQQHQQQLKQQKQQQLKQQQQQLLLKQQQLKKQQQQLSQNLCKFLAPNMWLAIFSQSNIWPEKAIIGGLVNIRNMTLLIFKEDQPENIYLHINVSSKHCNLGNLFKKRSSRCELESEV